MPDQPGAVDLEALRRQLQAVATTGRSIEFRSEHATAILAALERIPELERERDDWRLAATDWEALARTYIASNAHLRRRAGLLDTSTRGLLDCHEYLAEKANGNHESCSKVQAARAALASAPEDSPQLVAPTPIDPADAERLKEAWRRRHGTVEVRNLRDTGRDSAGGEWRGDDGWDRSGA